MTHFLQALESEINSGVKPNLLPLVHLPVLGRAGSVDFDYGPLPSFLRTEERPEGEGAAGFLQISGSI